MLRQPKLEPIRLRVHRRRKRNTHRIRSSTAASALAALSGMATSGVTVTTTFGIISAPSRFGRAGTVPKSDIAHMGAGADVGDETRSHDGTLLFGVRGRLDGCSFPFAPAIAPFADEDDEEAKTTADLTAIRARSTHLL
jgi:hypothetical protein